MPTLLQASPFIRTYVADAGSAPTSIVAKIGFLPPDSFSNTRARCLKESSAAIETAFPSRIMQVIEKLQNVSQ